MAEDKKDVQYDAPWAENLKHRPEPNRVRTLQTPTPGRFRARPPAAQAIPPDPATLHEGRTPPPADSLARGHDPQAISAEPSYYDIPLLKEPVWKWEIATYFFLGGLSAGSYLLGRAAERAGGKRYEDLTRLAAYVALGALAPCPPLLITDLGDPKRFHHMLRIWKPGSPMNFGSWAITAYGGMAAYEVVRQALTERDLHLPARQRSALLKVMNNPVLLLLHDAAGVPFSLVVAGYTGVLLSCTANPLWCKNPYLGPLFSASAISTGAEALSLALDCVPGKNSDLAEQQRALRCVDTIAHVAEIALMQGFMHFAGEKAKPLREGHNSKHHHRSIGGILLAEFLKLLPVPRPLKRPVRMMWNILGLGAGFSLRWGMIFGGHEAAADPHLSRLAGRSGTASRGNPS